MDTTDATEKLKTVCAWCNLHMVDGKTEDQAWDRVEVVSHGICLDCLDDNFVVSDD